MEPILYCIENEYGSVIAKDLTVDTAMILLRALLDYYFSEEGLTYTVKRQMSHKDIE